MPVLRHTSTQNIKPSSISTTNIKPVSVSTERFSAYINPLTSNRYGSFKYSAKKYGSTTEYSVGQKMPSISTEVI